MYYTVIKHSSHLRTLGKCRKHSPAARTFYISLVFSNACRVLSQCKTQLRLLYLLNMASVSEFLASLLVRPNMREILRRRLHQECESHRKKPESSRNAVKDGAYAHILRITQAMVCARALELTLTQSTAPPSTRLKLKQNCLSVTKSILMNLNLNQEHRNSRISLTNKCQCLPAENLAVILQKLH